MLENPLIPTVKFRFVFPLLTYLVVFISAGALPRRLVLKNREIAEPVGVCLLTSTLCFILSPHKQSTQRQETRGHSGMAAESLGVLSWGLLKRQCVTRRLSHQDNKRDLAYQRKNCMTDRLSIEKCLLVHIPIIILPAFLEG